MDRLLVVDGSNLLFQMFYGMPARITNAEGKAIQGTLGFVGALLKMLRMVEPTHLVALFDGETFNERVELDPEYKGNRVDYSQLPEEDAPFSQLPDIYRALDCLGVCHRETKDCEADDWIASYAACAHDGLEVVIASQDSDFFQLIGDHVRVLRYRGEKSTVCDRTYICEKLGVEPRQYAAYKSLTGDVADNIRGVEKVGPKTAAALVKQFGDLDTLLERAEEIAKPSVRKSVQEFKEQIRKNFKLICLSGERPVPFEMEELAYHHNGMTTTEVLKAIGLR